MREKSVGFADLHTQMKITNKLLSAQLREKIGQQELIQLLSTTGATDGEIADVLGTTAGTVSTTRQRLKKKAKK
jgi:DNA-binding CsgD family transcriptional regulator